MRRQKSNITLAIAIVASSIALASCGGGDDSSSDNGGTPSPSPGPAPAPTPAPTPTPTPGPGPAPAPTPGASIPLESSYAAESMTCTVGDDPATRTTTAGVSVSYANNTITVDNPGAAGQDDIVFDAGTPTDPNPEGTDDQATNPTSATYLGTAVLGSEAQDVVMSVSASDMRLLGVLYNPRPADTSPAEIQRIQDARVRCGNQVE